MWHRRIYYHLAAHAHRAGPPPVDLISEDGTVKALVLLLAFAATLLAGSERRSDFLWTVRLQQPERR
jgi:hypothetical protein